MIDTLSAWLCDKQGAMIRPLTGLSAIDIALVLGGSGHFALEWPLGQQGEDLARLLRKDRRVVILRKLPGLSPIVICSGFLRAWTLGQGLAKLAGPDLNSLLGRRIVAYEAGSSQASKSGEADDLIKALARENLGASATDADRDMSDYGFLVAADATAGPSIDKAFAWRELPRVVADLCNAAREAGTEILWQIEPLGLSGAILRTWAGYRGNRTFPSGGPPLEFSEARGNLTDAEYFEDWRQEANLCYAGGAGREAARTVLEVEGSGATDPLSRIEAFINASSQGTDSTAVTDMGKSKLAANRPVRGFRGTLRESPGQIFGVHWRLGDLVTARHMGRPHNVLIRAVSISKRPFAPTEILSKYSIEAV